MKKNKTLVIIGAGGHGLVVADCALSIGYYSDLIFLDDCLEKLDDKSQWQVSGPIASWPNYSENADFIVAIGNNTMRATKAVLLIPPLLSIMIAIFKLVAIFLQGLISLVGLMLAKALG